MDDDKLVEANKTAVQMRVEKHKGLAKDLKSLLSKDDYPSYLEYALDIRKKIVTGDDLPKDMEIFAGNDWAVENCTEHF